MARKIGGVFGRRPFGPLHEHVLKVTASLEAFSKMMGHFIEGDFQEAHRASVRVHDMENEADTIKNEIKRRLSGSIFNAVERSEILQLLRAQDNLSDRANSVAKTVSIRNTEVPAALRTPLKELTGQVVKTCADYARIVRDLQNFERNPTRHEQLEEITSAVEKVHYDDHVAGAMRTELLKKLFEMESKLQPLTILMLKDIIERTSSITGFAENAADAIGRIILLR